MRIEIKGATTPKEIKEKGLINTATNMNIEFNDQDQISMLLNFDEDIIRRKRK